MVGVWSPTDGERDCALRRSTGRDSRAGAEQDESEASSETKSRPGRVWIRPRRNEVAAREMSWRTFREPVSKSGSASGEIIFVGHDMRGKLEQEILRVKRFFLDGRPGRVQSSRVTSENSIRACRRLRGAFRSHIPNSSPAVAGTFTL